MSIKRWSIFRNFTYKDLPGLITLNFLVVPHIASLNKRFCIYNTNGKGTRLFSHASNLCQTAWFSSQHTTASISCLWCISYCSIWPGIEAKLSSETFNNLLVSPKFLGQICITYKFYSVLLKENWKIQTL